MNAKVEFLIEVKGKPCVKCVEIYTESLYGEKEVFLLKVGYTKEEYEEFLSKLDFEYEDGYGVQVLFGTIWLEDGTWFSRGEYDGLEWWVYNKVPVIPEELR